MKKEDDYIKNFKKNILESEVQKPKDTYMDKQIFAHEHTHTQTRAHINLDTCTHALTFITRRAPYLDVFKDL